MPLKILFAIISITFLASCSLSVPNNEVCADKGTLGARCAFTVSGPARNIAKAEWDEVRFGNFCMSPEAFAANQKFMEQACELVKGCDVVELKRLQMRFFYEQNLSNR